MALNKRRWSCARFDRPSCRTGSLSGREKDTDPPCISMYVDPRSAPRSSRAETVGSCCRVSSAFAPVSACSLASDVERRISNGAIPAISVNTTNGKPTIAAIAAHRASVVSLCRISRATHSEPTASATTDPIATSTLQRRTGHTSRPISHSSPQAFQLKDETGRGDSGHHVHRNQAVAGVMSDMSAPSEQAEAKRLVKSCANRSARSGRIVAQLALREPTVTRDDRALHHVERIWPHLPHLTHRGEPSTVVSVMHPTRICHL